MQAIPSIYIYPYTYITYTIYNTDIHIYIYSTLQHILNICIYICICMCHLCRQSDHQHCCSLATITCAHSSSCTEGQVQLGGSASSGTAWGAAGGSSINIQWSKWGKQGRTRKNMLTSILVAVNRSECAYLNHRFVEYSHQKKLTTVRTLKDCSPFVSWHLFQAGKRSRLRWLRDEFGKWCRGVLPWRTRSWTSGGRSLSLSGLASCANSWEKQPTKKHV